MYLLRVIACIFACTVMANSTADAQTAGSVTGIVRDADTGETMPSTSIRIQGKKAGVISDLDGRYRLLNLEPGSYTLVASYVGYTDTEQSVTIRAGEITRADFAIHAETVEGGETVVRGARLGDAMALNRQKNADTIQNVVSSDEVGRFPDPNTADALQRVPAVSITRDMGEGRYIMIRGMNPDLNSISINGQRLPSPDSDSRAVPLDVIPADLIGSLEINKSLTPDMDADAIGGSVNIVTKSPFDYSGRTIRGTVGGGLNLINNKGNGQTALTYSDVFDKWGVTIAGNYNRTDRATYNNKFKYTDEDVNGVEQRVYKEVDTQDYTTVRTRIGASGTLDYQINPDSRLYFTGIYNWYDDNETRYGNHYVFKVDEEDNQVFTSPTSFTNARLVKHIKPRQETQIITSWSAGGEHLLQNLIPNLPVNIDYQIAYSYAQEKEPDRYDSAFEQKDVNINWANSVDQPRMYPDAAKFTDYNAYEFDELEYEDNLTKDTDLSAQANLDMPVMLMDNPLDLKFGGKIRLKTKENDPNYALYSWDGDTDFTLNEVLGSYLNDDYMYGDMGPQGKYQNRDAFVRFFNAHKSDFAVEETDTRVETDSNTYDATENVYAAYGQAKYNIGNLSLLGGVRVEATSIEYNGNEVDINDEGDYTGTTKKTGTRDYTDIFPSIQAKYAFDENTAVRAAMTTAISRPNYYSLVPYNIVNRADQEIDRGNPDLDPTRSLGFDLMAEHYMPFAGIISGGVFYKSIDDHLVESQSIITYNNAEYELSQWINGTSATLTGVEVNFSRQLSFLPGLFSGFGIEANYTFTDSEADVVIEGVKRTTDFPGQSSNMGNFAISYEAFGFRGRFAVNHQSKFLSEVGEEKALDYYIDNHTQLDLSLSQRVYKDVNAFFEVQNITDEPLREYEGDTDHPTELEYYGRWISLGLKVDY